MVKEKIVKLMSLMLTPFEQTVNGMVSQFREQLKQGYDELPAAELEAADVIEKALRGGRSTITDRIVGVFEQHFTEAQLDAVIAYQESEIARHLASVSPEIQASIAMLTDDWLQETLRGVEPQLKDLLGPNTPVPAEMPIEVVTAA